MLHAPLFHLINLYNNTRTVRKITNDCYFLYLYNFSCLSGGRIFAIQLFRVASVPYIERVGELHKAGLLTLFHSQAPSRRWQWLVACEYNGTYSCGTVGDFHSIPFLIASIANLTTAKL